ncbi:hypothetical protein ACEUAI_21150 [Aeromonas veronii]
MLISKCKLFSEGADLQLAKLYLEQCDDLTLDELTDQSGATKMEPWWGGLLARTVTDEMQQLLSVVAMNKRSLQTADFIFERLSEDDKVRMYRWALGLQDEQPISLDSMLRNVGYSELGSTPVERYNAVSLAMQGSNQIALNGRESKELPWLGLTDLTYKLPIPASIRDDVHQLIWQVRGILQAGTSGQPSLNRSNTSLEREFFTGTFKTLLWREGCDDIVKSLDDEYKLILATGERSEDEVNKSHLEYLLLALQNENLSENLKSEFLNKLFGNAYGQARPSDLVPLFRDGAIPDSYLPSVVDYYLCRGRHNNKAAKNEALSSANYDLLYRFLNSGRLSDDDRLAIIKAPGNSSLMHDFIEMPDATYKHAKHLTVEEIAFQLSQCTQGYIAVDGTSQNYASLCEEIVHHERISLKATLEKNTQKLNAIIGNCNLSTKQIIQIANLFLVISAPKMMGIFVGKQTLADSTVSALYNHLKNQPDDLSYEQRSNINTAILKVGQIYLCNKGISDEQLKRYLDEQLMNRELLAHRAGNWEVTSTLVPISLDSLVATIDYQPGYAFELIDQFMQRHEELAAKATDCTWDAASFHAGLSDESSKMDTLIKLAMTREIYPAIINGREMDLPLCERMLKLAVAHSRIEEFDVQVLCKIKNPDHFLRLANALFAEPGFMQSHQQAYEELTASVLKRKTSEAMASMTPENRARPCL